MQSIAYNRGFRVNPRDCDLDHIFQPQPKIVLRVSGLGQILEHVKALQFNNEGFHSPIRPEHIKIDRHVVVYYTLGLIILSKPNDRDV